MCMCICVDGLVVPCLIFDMVDSFLAVVDEGKRTMDDG